MDIDLYELAGYVETLRIVDRMKGKEFYYRFAREYEPECVEDIENPKFTLVSDVDGLRL